MILPFNITFFFFSGICFLNFIFYLLCILSFSSYQLTSTDKRATLKFWNVQGKSGRLTLTRKPNKILNFCEKQVYTSFSEMHWASNIPAGVSLCSLGRLDFGFTEFSIYRLGIQAL